MKPSYLFKISVVTIVAVGAISMWSLVAFVGMQDGTPAEHGSFQSP